MAKPKRKPDHENRLRADGKIGDACTCGWVADCWSWRAHAAAARRRGETTREGQHSILLRTIKMGAPTDTERLDALLRWCLIEQPTIPRTDHRRFIKSRRDIDKLLREERRGK